MGCDKLTSMSRQAAFSSVIWSAMVSVVKPGSCLANSTVFMMHFVDSSLNLSQRLTSRGTRCSELLLCRQRTGKWDFFMKPGNSNSFVMHKWNVGYRCIFSQLTEWGKRVLMGSSDSFDHLLCVCWQDVDLHLYLPLLLLLLLGSVISHHWREGDLAQTLSGDSCWAFTILQTERSTIRYSGLKFINLTTLSAFKEKH